MEWTRPGIGRRFDFRDEDEEGCERYMITLQITNMDPEHNIAAIHLPFEQEGWSMEKPGQSYLEAAVEGLTPVEGGEPWRCHTYHREEFVGKKRGLTFHSGSSIEGKWGSYLEFGQSATLTFEAVVTSAEPLRRQSLTLKYLPALSWEPYRGPNDWRPELRWSPYYSSNLDLEIGHLA